LTTLNAPMTRRLALITTMLVLAVAAPASAQSGAFGPLPQAAPSATPTPTPASSSDNSTSSKVLIVIGAGDTRFLMWGMLLAAAVYIPLALLALWEDWGILGVWWGLLALIAVGLVTCGARFLSSRWALTGAPA